MPPDPRAPRVLVLGGSGAIGAGVVERARELGFEVTAAGRRAPPSPALRARLLDPLGVPYVRVDLAEDVHGELRTLLSEHELVIVACEPWSAASVVGWDPADGMRRLYETARCMGYDVERNRRAAPRRRIVRVGSSAAELPHALLDAPGTGWPEDRVSLDALETLAGSDPAWDNHYFRTKVALARAAHGALRKGVDVVTALPTYVLSAWGDRGREEPLVQAYRVARATGFIPSIPLDVIPVQSAAAGILLTGLQGPPGERYQLCGVETNTHALHAGSLRHLGLHPQPFPVPRGELRDELRLLSGRARGNPWLELCLSGWDAWRRAALRRFAVEPWHIAVMLEGCRRSAEKLRDLSRNLPPECRVLRPPEPDEIPAMVDEEARRKVEWLVADGRLGEERVPPPGAPG